MTDTDFSDFKVDKSVEIPCEDATKSSLAGLGELFLRREYSRVDTQYCPLIDPTTNREIALKNEDMPRLINSSQMNAHVNIKDGRTYRYARIDDENPFKFYLRTFERLPHSSKTIMSVNDDPFILVLGKKPNDLKAFIFRGDEGVRIHPRIWHSPPIIHYAGDVQFSVKQSVMDLKVVYDAYKETGQWPCINYA
jgi:ureidoglycolate hydrolase